MATDQDPDHDPGPTAGLQGVGNTTEDGSMRVSKGVMATRNRDESPYCCSITPRKAEREDEVSGCVFVFRQKQGEVERSAFPQEKKGDGGGEPPLHGA